LRLTIIDVWIVTLESNLRGPKRLLANKEYVWEGLYRDIERRASESLINSHKYLELKDKFGNFLHRKGRVRKSYTVLYLYT